MLYAIDGEPECRHAPKRIDLGEAVDVEVVPSMLSQKRTKLVKG